MVTSFVGMSGPSNISRPLHVLYTHVVIFRDDSFTFAQLKLDEGNEFIWMGGRLEYVHGLSETEAEKEMYMIKMQLCQ